MRKDVKTYASIFKGEGLNIDVAFSKGDKFSICEVG